jgi:Putative sensor
MQDHGRMGSGWLATLVRAPIAGRTGRDYLYLLVSAPVALVAFVTLAVAAWVGALASLLLIGIPLLALIVLGAREFGAVPRALARDLLGVRVAAPRRRRPRRHGVLAWLRASLGDLDGWRAIAYIVVSFPLTVVGAYLVAVSFALAVVLLTYPVWWQLFDPTTTDAAGVAHHSGLHFGDTYI